MAGQAHPTGGQHWMNSSTIRSKTDFRDQLSVCEQSATEDSNKKRRRSSQGLVESNKKKRTSPFGKQKSDNNTPPLPKDRLAHTGNMENVDSSRSAVTTPPECVVTPRCLNPTPDQTVSPKSFNSTPAKVITPDCTSRFLVPGEVVIPDCTSETGDILENNVTVNTGYAETLCKRQCIHIPTGELGTSEYIDVNNNVHIHRNADRNNNVHIHSEADRNNNVHINESTEDMCKQDHIDTDSRNNDALIYGEDGGMHKYYDKGGSGNLKADSINTEVSFDGNDQSFSESDHVLTKNRNESDKCHTQTNIQTGPDGKFYKGSSHNQYTEFMHKKLRHKNCENVVDHSNRNNLNNSTHTPGNEVKYTAHKSHSNVSTVSLDAVPINPSESRNHPDSDNLNADDPVYDQFNPYDPIENMSDQDVDQFNPNYPIEYMNDPVYDQFNPYDPIEDMNDQDVDQFNPDYPIEYMNDPVSDQFNPDDPIENMNEEPQYYEVDNMPPGSSKCYDSSQHMDTDDQEQYRESPSPKPKKSGNDFTFLREMLDLIEGSEGMSDDVSQLSNLPSGLQKLTSEKSAMEHFQDKGPHITTSNEDESKKSVLCKANDECSVASQSSLPKIGGLGKYQPNKSSLSYLSPKTKPTIPETHKGNFILAGKPTIDSENSYWRKHLRSPEPLRFPAVDTNGHQRKTGYGSSNDSPRSDDSCSVSCQSHAQKRNDRIENLMGEHPSKDTIYKNAIYEYYYKLKPSAFNPTEGPSLKIKDIRFHSLTSPRKEENEELKTNQSRKTEIKQSDDSQSYSDKTQIEDLCPSLVSGFEPGPPTLQDSFLDEIASKSSSWNQRFENAKQSVLKSIYSSGELQMRNKYTAEDLRQRYAQPVTENQPGVRNKETSSNFSVYQIGALSTNDRIEETSGRKTDSRLSGPLMDEILKDYDKEGIDTEPKNSKQLGGSSKYKPSPLKDLRIKSEFNDSKKSIRRRGSTSYTLAEKIRYDMEERMQRNSDHQHAASTSKMTEVSDHNLNGRSDSTLNVVRREQRVFDRLQIGSSLLKYDNNKVQKEYAESKRRQFEEQKRRQDILRLRFKKEKNSQDKSHRPVYKLTEGDAEGKGFSLKRIDSEEDRTINMAGSSRSKDGMDEDGRSSELSNAESGESQKFTARLDHGEGISVEVKCIPGKRAKNNCKHPTTETLKNLDKNKNKVKKDGRSAKVVKAKKTRFNVRFDEDSKEAIKYMSKNVADENIGSSETPLANTEQDCNTNHNNKEGNSETPGSHSTEELNTNRYNNNTHEQNSTNWHNKEAASECLNDNFNNKDYTCHEHRNWNVCNNSAEVASSGPEVPDNSVLSEVQTAAYPHTSNLMASNAQPCYLPYGYHPYYYYSNPVINNHYYSQSYGSGGGGGGGGGGGERERNEYPTTGEILSFSDTKTQKKSYMKNVKAFAEGVSNQGNIVDEEFTKLKEPQPGESSRKHNKKESISSATSNSIIDEQFDLVGRVMRESAKKPVIEALHRGKYNNSSGSEIKKTAENLGSKKGAVEKVQPSEIKVAQWKNERFYKDWHRQKEMSKISTSSESNALLGQDKKKQGSEPLSSTSAETVSIKYDPKKYSPPTKEERYTTWTEARKKQQNQKKIEDEIKSIIGSESQSNKTENEQESEVYEDVRSVKDNDKAFPKDRWVGATSEAKAHVKSMLKKMIVRKVFEEHTGKEYPSQYNAQKDESSIYSNDTYIRKYRSEYEIAKRELARRNSMHQQQEKPGKDESTTDCKKVVRVTDGDRCYKPGDVSHISDPSMKPSEVYYIRKSVPLIDTVDDTQSHSSQVPTSSILRNGTEQPVTKPGSTNVVEDCHRSVKTNNSQVSLELNVKRNSSQVSLESNVKTNDSQVSLESDGPQYSQSFTKKIMPSPIGSAVRKSHDGKPKKEDGKSRKDKNNVAQKDDVGALAKDSKELQKKMVQHDTSQKLTSKKSESYCKISSNKKRSEANSATKINISAKKSTKELDSKRNDEGNQLDSSKKEIGKEENNKQMDNGKELHSSKRNVCDSPVKVVKQKYSDKNVFQSYHIDKKSSDKQVNKSTSKLSQGEKRAKDAEVIQKSATERHRKSEKNHSKESKIHNHDNKSKESEKVHKPSGINSKDNEKKSKNSEKKPNVSENKRNDNEKKEFNDPKKSSNVNTKNRKEKGVSSDVGKKKSRVKLKSFEIQSSSSDDDIVQEPIYQPDFSLLDTEDSDDAELLTSVFFTEVPCKYTEESVEQGQSVKTEAENSSKNEPHKVNSPENEHNAKKNNFSNADKVGFIQDKGDKGDKGQSDNKVNETGKSCESAENSQSHQIENNKVKNDAGSVDFIKDKDVNGPNDIKVSFDKGPNDIKVNKTSKSCKLAENSKTKQDKSNKVTNDSSTGKYNTSDRIDHKCQKKTSRTKLSSLQSMSSKSVESRQTNDHQKISSDKNIKKIQSSVVSSDNSKKMFKKDGMSKYSRQTPVRNNTPQSTTNNKQPEEDHSGMNSLKDYLQGKLRRSGSQCPVQSTGDEDRDNENADFFKSDWLRSRGTTATNVYNPWSGERKDGNLRKKDKKVIKDKYLYLIDPSMRARLNETTDTFTESDNVKGNSAKKTSNKSQHKFNDINHHNAQMHSTTSGSDIHCVVTVNSPPNEHQAEQVAVHADITITLPTTVKKTEHAHRRKSSREHNSQSLVPVRNAGNSRDMFGKDLGKPGFLLPFHTTSLDNSGGAYSLVPCGSEHSTDNMGEEAQKVYNHILQSDFGRQVAKELYSVKARKSNNSNRRRSVYREPDHSDDISDITTNTNTSEDDDNLSIYTDDDNNSNVSNSSKCLRQRKVKLNKENPDLKSYYRKSPTKEQREERALKAIAQEQAKIYAIIKMKNKERVVRGDRALRLGEATKEEGTAHNNNISNRLRTYSGSSAGATIDSNDPTIAALRDFDNYSEINAYESSEDNQSTCSANQQQAGTSAMPTTEKQSSEIVEKKKQSAVGQTDEHEVLKYVDEIEQSLVNYSTQKCYDRNSLESECGYVNLPSIKVWLPYVEDNGYKYVPVREVAPLFRNCLGRCSIPRSTIQKDPGLEVKMCNHHQANLFGNIWPIGSESTNVHSGDMMVKWDKFCNNYRRIRRLVVELHRNTTRRWSKQCKYTFRGRAVQFSVP